MSNMCVHKATPAKQQNQEATAINIRLKQRALSAVKPVPRQSKADGGLHGSRPVRCCPIPAVDAAAAATAAAVAVALPLGRRGACGPEQKVAHPLCELLASHELRPTVSRPPATVTRACGPPALRRVGSHGDPPA
eukprot:CAMPEP_0171630654 /NCGR_PEP_ID=MMETSP0990-20121206/23074_1 /TAXON_ID=483369 /ORGANISM="non described non described, Strain CCMP2098" /LENGTH=134 /DNA_ID=CAMNT_0012199897 /DNA_START=51 /DNA_END=453 /DNA_ORIENTATION=-